MDSTFLLSIRQYLTQISFFTEDVRRFLLAQAEGMESGEQQKMLHVLEEYLEESSALEAEYKENKRLLDTEVTAQLGRITAKVKTLQRAGRELFASEDADQAENVLNNLK